jgi:hypothetical protein
METRDCGPEVTTTVRVSALGRGSWLTSHGRVAILKFEPSSACANSPLPDYTGLASAGQRLWMVIPLTGPFRRNSRDEAEDDSTSV